MTRWSRRWGLSRALCVGGVGQDCSPLLSGDDLLGHLPEDS